MRNGLGRQKKTINKEIQAIRSDSEVRKCYFDHWLASRVSDSQVHIGAISLSKKSPRFRGVS